MEFLSPLRYPGGKAKVADFVQCLIKENALLDGTYVEPYVGGGSVHYLCSLMNMSATYI